MKLHEMIFRRKFSLNMCKTLTLPMAEMTFTSDFYDTDRGDLYPLTAKNGEPTEEYAKGIYTLRGEGDAYTERFFTQLFPYASYEMTTFGGGTAGFVFSHGSSRASVCFVPEGDKYTVTYKSRDMDAKVTIDANRDGTLVPVISLRPGAFEIYVRREWGIQYIRTLKSEEFADSQSESFFTEAAVSVYAEAGASFAGVRAYIDSGLGIADMRSVRYESSEVILEGGKLYFTASIRRRWGTHQGVFSWVPGTSDIQLVGALFFDAGDGRWCDDVATSLIFNRMTNKWHLHVASFNHGHIVGSAIFDDDIRFGVNVVDIKLMEPMQNMDGSEDTLLLGKDGDEDPDLIYDERRGKWLFSICRHVGLTNKYKYFFFESDYPDRDFVSIGEGIPGQETGGSIMNIDGEMYFICGNSRKLRSDYRVYRWGEFDKFETLKFDRPDGGFRGWGTILPIKLGTRQRLFHLTFDRVRTSEYEWSYGNLYCFEGQWRKV